LRVVRVLNGEDARYGLADDCTVTLISDEPFAAWEREEDVSLSQAKLLAPVVPTKIVCVGINYRTHAAEMGHKLPKNPVIFLKPPTAVNCPCCDIQYPPSTSRLDYEGELAIVMGRRARHVEPKEAAHHILGYTCANDVTARDLQAIDGQWTRAKGFDGFCPLGPWVETDVDPMDLHIETLLNGQVVQDARTSDMVFDPYRVVSFVSGIMTLLPGDVILTGTPGGIGPMDPGDTVEVRIEGIGTLKNRLV
jgi:2-keto-4-pentenoate hydratase/2-oxohepta-3-ene-1,7-dioic acid hydratase in catechol pathway